MIEIKCIRRRSKSSSVFSIANHLEANLADDENNFHAVPTQESKAFQMLSFPTGIVFESMYRYVCNNVFMKTHGVTAHRVSRLCSLLLLNQTTENRRGDNWVKRKYTVKFVLKFMNI